MRVEYTVMIAAGLCASGSGLHVTSNFLKVPVVAAPSDTNSKPVVEDKTAIMFMGDSKNETYTPPGYHFTVSQDEGDGIFQQEDEYEEDSESVSSDGSDDNERPCDEEGKTPKELETMSPTSVENSSAPTSLLSEMAQIQK